MSKPVSKKTNLKIAAANPISGYEIVADLLERQDVVLNDLNVLNDRIEMMINDISATRHGEMNDFLLDAA